MALCPAKERLLKPFLRFFVLLSDDEKHLVYNKNKKVKMNSFHHFLYMNIITGETDRIAFVEFCGKKFFVPVSVIKLYFQLHLKH